MLDTVILTIPVLNYEVLNPAKFTPNADRVLKGNNYLLKCVNNPTSLDKKKDIYKPRLTLIRRRTPQGDEIPLKIEFSVPKLLFNNNLDEIEEKDFQDALTILSKKLFEMGVWVKEDVLKKAKVSALHVSKNIALSDGYTSTMAIKELAKVNLTKKLDLTKTKFTNEGHSLQYYSNSHSFVIYDKIQDLRKPKGRAMDKDQTKYQTSIFDLIQNKKKYFEILRLEIRLSKKVKLTSVLKKLGFNPNLKFIDVFNKDLCKAIIQSYWHELVYDMNIFLFEMDNKPVSLLKEIQKQSPDVNAKQAIYLIGLNLLCKDRGIREFRSLIEQKYSKKTWTRIVKDIHSLNTYSDNSKIHGFIKDIDEGINKFETLRINKNDLYLC